MWLEKERVRSVKFINVAWSPNPKSADMPDFTLTSNCYQRKALPLRLLFHVSENVMSLMAHLRINFVFPISKRESIFRTYIPLEEKISAAMVYWHAVEKHITSPPRWPVFLTINIFTNAEKQVRDSQGRSRSENLSSWLPVKKNGLIPVPQRLIQR